MDKDDDYKNMLTRLSTTLGVQDNLPAAVKPEDQKKNHEDDYTYTRDKMKNLAKIGEEALEHFKDIAMETGEPGAFRVLAELLTATGSLVEGIAKNSRNKAEIDKSIQTPIENRTTNNLFVGNTKELLEKLNQEDKIIIDVDPK